MTTMRPHERIAEKHNATIVGVNAPILAVRGGQVFRLEWTANELTGHGTTEDRQTVRWAAYNIRGGWQGTFTRRRDAVDAAAFDPDDYADVAYHVGLA